MGEPPAARRRLATVLFCDIAGSTELGERLDPESVRELMLRYFAEMRTAVERHGGLVEKFIGDAVMAIFGVPITHEDDALRALRAAAEMTARLAQLNADIGSRYGAPLAMRIGINTGEVVATDAPVPEHFVTGDIVNTAARLQTAAEINQTLLGRTTYELTRHAVATEPLPPLNVKGKSRPVSAYRLVGMTPHAFPPRPVTTPMVGRTRELAHLQGLFRQVQAEHHAALVTVVGEAGIGKSRLTRELQESLRGTARAEVGRCVSYGEAITFAPLAETVRRVLGLDPGASGAEAESRIGASVQGSAARAVAAGIGLSREAVPLEEISWALRRFFETLAAGRPLLLVIEDLHWGEDLLLDLLVRFVEEANEPALVLCTARPELVEQHPDWPVTIALEPLSPEEAMQITRPLQLPDETRDRVIAAAGGNPLFLEELVEFVGEREDQRFLPPALHALLGARLDQLAAADRATVERAAVEGELLHVGAALRLTPAASRAGVVGSLQRLESRLLIYAADAQFPDERAFRFKHALIRDAAYQSIPKRVRSELHQRYAEWLERKTGDGVSEHEETLGHHLEQAYRNRLDLRLPDPETQALGERAAARLAGAGRRNLELGLHASAGRLLRRAASLLPAGHDDRDEVILDLGHALVGAGEFAPAADAFEDVQRLARSKADQRLELHAALAQLNVRSSVDPALRADELIRAGHQAIPVFRDPADHRGLATAWWLVSWAHLKLSRYAESGEAAERGLEHARLARDRRDQARFLGTIALGLYWGPLPVDAALARCNALLAGGEGWRTVEAFVLRARAVLMAMQGRFAEARACVARGEDIHRELGQRASAAGAATEAGKIELLADDPDAAERVLRLAYDALDAIGNRNFRAVVGGRLAQALYAQERLDAAAALAEDTLSSAATDDVFPRVVSLGVSAKVLARRGDTAEAEALCRVAVNVAATTDDLELHGDATRDLAEVLTVAHRGREAATLSEAAAALYERKGDVVSARRAARLAAPS
jgi:class 3 adenylate cyclase/tetratricopeptide (TPR) repeat protein